jgi:membrane-bound serine protease (ClpP class)
MRPLLAVAVVGALAPLAPADQAAPQPGATQPVVVARVEDQAITPATARYLRRALGEADRQQATCLVVVLDTPGGLVDSTRDMVRAILGSRIPVVVYVAPSGARAASAGVFLTLSGHVAAMAPGTHIGAAHPVQIGGLPGGPRDPDEKEKAADPVSEKILNDTVAWARALADLRGRNAEWAVRTVSESLSVPADEALREKAIDLIAADLDSLLAALDGRSVSTVAGPVNLRTAGAPVVPVEMWWGEHLLAVLSNPNLALLLLMLGFYGILFELYTPGWGVGGTLGVICLVLGFVSLAVLPINYAGLALIAVALALFVAEAFVTSYGALTAGGLVCLILGGTMLVDSPAGFDRVSLGVLIPIAGATAFVTLFLVGSVVRAHRRRAATGNESLPGTHAEPVEAFTPSGDEFVGTVRTQGELWSARSPVPVVAGQQLEVLGREGLTLLVHPVSPSQPH